MMRSLYSGVSGMQNHQTRLDVIGNNVANVNTTGFKRGRVNFHDMISQQLSGAASPTTEVGGVNPKEVGLGVMVASIDTIFTQGNLQSTGVSTDVAIQGNGFFVLKNGEETFYSRAGAFGVDSEGTLVNPANGMRVQGWMAEELNGEMILNTAGSTEDLIIPVGTKDPAKATENVNFACNLNKNTPEILDGASEADIAKGTWTTEQKIYDSFVLQAKDILSTGGKSFDVLYLLTRLRQVCISPSLVDTKFNKESSKLKLIKDTIIDYVANDHKILVFSAFVEALNLISDILNENKIKHYMLTGDTKATDRLAMATEFNANNKIKVFLISLKAGGVGLNLIGADTVIHVDPWWNVAAENQASDRAHRIGQVNNVEVIKMIINDSIEQRVIELQNIKKDLIDKVINNSDEALTKLSREDLNFILN